MFTFISATSAIMKSIDLITNIVAPIATGQVGQGLLVHDASLALTICGTYGT